ncbi:MAG: 4-hydroxythreonine-4-phosphate dehydrogenase PdxA [Motiliproteus sp.]
MTSILTPAIRIAITPGEPAGIGPDLCIKLAQQAHAHELVVIADPSMLMERAAQLGLPLSLQPVDFNRPASASKAGELRIQAVTAGSKTVPGQLDPDNARYVLETLSLAIQGCQSGKFSALVTAPVHKGNINEAGVVFSGHTEFLQQQTDTDEVVMMLATEGLRVALVTTHLPLSQVPAAITADKINAIAHILHQDLQQYFAISAPRILVCGLNPHAGEGGHLGREEIEVIEPALQQLRAEGINVVGPLPADTLFTNHLLKDADAVLAMYHDQGLPVLKYKGFGQSVNVTLGLPIIRTSVDHGTALDLAATGKGNCGSLISAINTAVEMATSKRAKG